MGPLTSRQSGMFSVVELPVTLETGLVAHARTCAPHECCGLLIGDEDRITDVHRARNLSSASRTRYEVDPVDHFAAIRRARAGGHTVIGGYHSHPAGPPLPSRSDLADAFGHFLFVIVGLGEWQARVAAWEYVKGNFVPVPLVRTFMGGSGGEGPR